MTEHELLPTGEALRDALRDLVPTVHRPLASARPALDVWYAPGGAAWRPVNSDEAGQPPGWLKLWIALLDAIVAPTGVTRIIALADPISLGFTAGWRVDVGATISPNSGVLRGATLRGMIGDLIDAMLSEKTNGTGTLQRRLGLQIVLFAPRPQARDLEILAREVYRQAGPYLIDIQLRLILDEDQFAPDERLCSLLAYHLPVDPWPRGAAWQRRDQEEFDGKLSALEVTLEQVDAHSRHTEDVFASAERITRAHAPGVQVRKDGVQTPGDTSPAPPFHLRWTLGLRRWCERPLTVTLAPLTLAYGENASGKTSLGEALCAAHLGAPRPRLWAPPHADRWNANDPALVLDVLVGDQDTAFEGELNVGDLLVLFADDADLSAGTAGDVAVASWAGFRGAGRLARRWMRIARRLRELQRSFDGPPLQTGPARHSGSWLTPERWVISAVRSYLETLEYRDIPEKPDDPDQIETWERETLADREYNAVVKAAWTAIGKRWVYLPPAALHPALVSGFALSVGERASKVQDGWLHLHQVDAWLGGGTALIAAARDNIRRRLPELHGELTDASERLAKQLSHDDKFEKMLEDYLSQDLFPRPPRLPRLPETRLNTATVVRLGQAGRLARWLTGGSADLPLLVVDEPTLGQDDAANGRALSRMLRLSRKVEAVRRSRWIQGQLTSEHHQTTATILESTLIGERNADTGCWSKESEARSSVPLGAPLPPQVIALSHREQTLAAVAELEGVTLTAGLRASLQALIPEPWWYATGESIRVALRDCGVVSPLVLHARWPADASALSAALKKGCEVDRGEGWRSWWEGDPRKKQAYPCLLERLRQLGLFEMTGDLEAAMKACVWPPVDERKVGTPPEVAELALRLVVWLASSDLLAAPLLDAEGVLEPSTVRMVEIPPLGGEAPEIGPTRLRRLSPLHDVLPELPSMWRAWLDDLPAPIVSALDPWPVQLSTKPDQLPTDQRERSLASLVEGAGLRLAGEGLEPGIMARLRATPLDGAVSYAWRLNHQLDALPADLTSWPDAVSDLQRRLIQRRLDRWPADQAVQIALCSDATEDSGPLRPHFRLYAPRIASEAVQAQVFGEGLQRLRAGLAALNPKPRIEFALRCTLPVALLAGSVFHRTSGFNQLSCHQLTGSDWTTWDLDATPAVSAAWGEVAFVEQVDVPMEVHVAISVSRDILDDVQHWRSVVTDPLAAHCPLIHARVAERGRESVPNASHAVGLAHDLFQRIESLRPNRSLPMRIFIAAPNALAMAIGREWNAIGRVLVMDLDKDTHTYRLALTFGSPPSPP